MAKTRLPTLCDHSRATVQLETKSGHRIVPSWEPPIDTVSDSIEMGLVRVPNHETIQKQMWHRTEFKFTSLVVVNKYSLKY